MSHLFLSLSFFLSFFLSLSLSLSHTHTHSLIHLPNHLSEVLLSPVNVQSGLLLNSFDLINRVGTKQVVCVFLDPSHHTYGAAWGPKRLEHRQTRRLRWDTACGDTRCFNAHTWSGGRAGTDKTKGEPAARRLQHSIKTTEIIEARAIDLRKQLYTSTDNMQGWLARLWISAKPLGVGLYLETDLAMQH